MSDSTKHMTYQPMPRLNTPLVDPGTGYLTTPWYRVFVTLLRRTGCIGAGDAQSAGVPSIQNGVVLGQDQEGAGLPVSAYNAADGTFLGQIQLGTESGGAAQPQAVGLSPWTFTAALPGVLVLDSGKTEVSRDGGSNYWLASLVGGGLSVVKGDLVRVTYLQAVPTAVFLPIGGLT